MADRLHTKERLEQGWKKIQCQGFRDGQWNNLCEEIEKYTRLKEEWKLGHVKLIVKRCNTVWNDMYHVRIMGCYVNDENVKKEVLLDYNFDAAMNRLNHVKSFL